MSAQGVCDNAEKAIRQNSHDVIIINFANPDMVGHTGDLEAAKRAVEVVDKAVGTLEKAVIEAGGAMLVTADHGNCEVMWDTEAESPHTAHTNNLVPLILVNGNDGVQVTDGRLADLAPSLLAMMGVEQPASMTGRPLFTAQ